jgi:DNA topoisomerase VI subunit B
MFFASLLATKCYAQQALGDPRGAITTIEQAADEISDPWRVVLVPAMVRVDRVDEAQRILERADAYTLPHMLVSAYAALGMRDEYYSALHQCIDDHALYAISNLRYSRRFRGDPRRPDLLKHLGQEVESSAALKP